MIDIKAVTPEEIPQLLALVRELAQYERLEHEVEATAESVRDSLFGPTAVAGALFGRVNGELGGYAIYYFTYSSFVGRRGLWLEDVYVKPEFRKQGLGRALIEAVARVGVEKNCGRFEWTALEWNEMALTFYRGLGARVLDDWRMLRMDAAGMRGLAEGKSKAR